MMTSTAESGLTPVEITKVSSFHFYADVSETSEICDFLQLWRVGLTIVTMTATPGAYDSQVAALLPCENILLKAITRIVALILLMTLSKE